MPGDPRRESDGFGQRLRVLRERAGLTQEELAERAALTPHAISALERGARTHPYPHTVRALADALNVSEAERTDLITSVPRRRRSVDGSERPDQPAERQEARTHRVSVPVPPTPLYGRERDIAEVTRLARSGNARLITLTGPGGVGKTRLAMAAAEVVAPDFSDGVMAVPLAALFDAREVLGTIGRALNLVVRVGSDSVDHVAEHLAELRLLLVLDNFEHLLSAAADVSRLVGACPRVTVLVTSRSPLRVRGEREFAVQPLTLPGGRVSSTADLERSAAGALALDRTREIAPLADLGPGDVAALAELCRRLAGLPLAIELATAHLRLLSPQRLLERLEHVGAAGVRDLPQRQQTMRATLDWSYQLLSDDQQRLFRLLGVFRGGATLAAVEEVAGASTAWSPEDVLALLGTLVEHSLVVVRPGRDLDLRYDMLEPVAQYARSLLIGDEAQADRHAHAQHVLALTEAAATGYEGADQVAWLDRIQADEANVVVAIDRCLDLGDAETAGRITWAMWLYWWLRSLPSVGRLRAEACLTAELSPPILARVQLAAATMCYASGDLPASAEHWELAFRLGTEQDDPEVACAGRAGTGLAALGLGELDQAEGHFRAALQLGVAAGESGIWLRSLVHVWLGTIRLAQEDPAGAVEEIEQGLRLARARGDRLSTYVALFNLAQTAITLGDHARARSHLSEGIALSTETQDLANLAYFLEALAVVESAVLAHHRVAVLLGAAQALRETMESKIYGYYLPDESLRARAEEQARAALGRDGYDDAVDAGRALSLEGAVRFARDPAAGVS